MVRSLEDKKKNAFTLVELLIVITIVSFLVTLISIGYLNQLRKARDAKRKSHLQKMRVAFEDYFNDWGCYPDDNTIFEDCDQEEFSPYLDRVYCDPFGNYYKLAPAESDCPDYYAIYTNLEYGKDPQLLANECYNVCTIEEEEYNFVVYSEGLAQADLPGLPDTAYYTPTPTSPSGPGDPTITPTPTSPSDPGDPTATPTPTSPSDPGDPTATPTASPTPGGPTPIPCTSDCYQEVSGECNGPKGPGDLVCTVNCYTGVTIDGQCDHNCWTPICNE